MKKTCELLEAVRSQCQLLEPDLRDRTMAGIPEKIAFLRLKIGGASSGGGLTRGPRGSSARRRRPARAAVVTPTDDKAPAPFSAELDLELGAADGGECKQS